MRLEVSGQGLFNYRVAGILINEGRVLLHHARNHHWALPGGHIEFQEAAATALAREMKEELDIEVTVGRLVWISEHTFSKGDRQIHEVAFYHEMALAGSDALLTRSGEFRGPEGDALTFAWVPLDDLADLVLYPTFVKEGLKHLPDRVTHVVSITHRYS